MGWYVQGYYKDPGEDFASWHVECSGDDLIEIDEYAGFSPLPLEAKELVEIYYGNTGLEIFRGLVIAKSISTSKEYLNYFNELPVYKKKWAAVAKRFFVNEMMFIQSEYLCLFIEDIESPLVAIGLQDLLSRIADKESPFWVNELKLIKENELLTKYIP